MSNENLSAAGDTAASHDEQAAPSTAPEAEASLQGQVEASATETTDEPKKVNKVQQRINQLTRERYDARQETADLRKQVEELKSNQKPVEPKQPTVNAPKEDDFDSDELDS